MAGLPPMVHADGIQKYRQTVFAGYDHTLGADNGAIWDMENLTGELYPLLSPRRQRWVAGKLDKPNGLYAHDGLYWVDGDSFFAQGNRVGTVTDSRKRFASLGAYVVILPDRAYYNRLTGEFGLLEVEWSGGATIQDGTFAQEEAKANTIYAAGADWASKFRVGDAVTISGCSLHPENNKTPVIREIDGDKLRFYENTFTIGEGGDSENAVTVKRCVPDMDFICENENRLWGCKANTIYACKLGDIFNWNVFDGLATDSYAVDVASMGNFTGCCSYLGYPVFFKEEHIYKVYGSKPANFQVMGSASLGVETGSGGSVAIAGETLFYLSRTGICGYTGGIPQSVAAPFGVQRFRDAVGGSDGTRYFVSMKDQNGNWHLFVYDSRRGLWHREDSREVVGFAWDGELYFLDGDGTLWIDGSARTVPEGCEREGAVAWSAEWADFYEYSGSSSSSAAIPQEKGIGKLLLRLELDEEAQVDILIQFDSDGEWRQVYNLDAHTKRSWYLPVVPRRCDHFRLRLEGRGGCRVYSLTREVYTGSEIQM